MAIGVNARTAFSLLFPPILDEFHWDRGVVAGVFSFGFFVSALLSPFVGRMVDLKGPRVVVETGWRGAPEEQGFLRDVQGAACQQFTTVLAPGSNKYHYNHIHVDLMRRASRRVICEPSAVSGEQIAARAGYRGSFAAARRPEPVYTGTLGGRVNHASKKKSSHDDEDIYDE